MTNMNQIHPSMQFIFEFDMEKITFLDTNVHIDSNQPNKLYVKPKDMPEPTRNLSTLPNPSTGILIK